MVNVVSASRKMSRLTRMLTAIASLALSGLFVLPLWRVQLVAPQYPEGLGMKIGISDVRGVMPTDLDNINGLNHYIGMKHITPAAIPELRYMPWIVAGLILVGLIAAVVGSRKLLFTWVGGFTLLAIAGLIDFWRWEYDYGHNIDFEHAIIKIPGMTYQPPLIGVKQLLNFTAISWPDAGAWLALAAFGMGVLAVITTFKQRVPAAQEHAQP
jgi:copper chaperone NosL